VNVTAAGPAELLWLELRTGCVLTRNATGIAAIDKAGLVRGVVAYDEWTPGSVQAHMAVDAPIVWRSLLGPAFAYPFVQSNREKLLGVIRSDNAKSLAMVKALGFKEAHRVVDGWERGVDLVLFEMRRETCRWIQPHRRAA
jgi:hypothetical protein